MLKKIVDELKAALILLVSVTAIHTIGDDVAHLLKNQALDSIEVDDTKTEEEKKAAISEALNNKQLYNKGVILEAVHDFLGEQKNPDNGFDDIDSGWIGAFDVLDVIADRTKMEKSPTTDNGKEVTEDATVAINWGEVTPVNLTIKYKQKMQGTLDFRRKEDIYVDPISNLDSRKMGSKDPADTYAIRIVLPYTYTNFYANDNDKIIIENKYDEKDGKVTINSVVKVYEDSFSNIPSPDKEIDETTAQLGFKFKEDKRNSKKEYEEAFEETKRQWMNTGMVFDEELLRTRTASKNANSYYASKKFFEEHEDRFANYRNEILKANDADAVQVCFTFFCYDLYNSTKSNIDKTLEANNTDIKVTDNTEVRVYHCKFEDRDKEENKDNFETVKVSSIDWPDNINNIYQVRNQVPLILPTDRYNKSTTMTETELDKVKREIINADTELPQISDGEKAAEEVKTYTVYDWGSIEEAKDEEVPEKEETQNGEAKLDKELIEFNRDPKNYIAGCTVKAIDGWEIEL